MFIPKYYDVLVMGLLESSPLTVDYLDSHYSNPTGDYPLTEHRSNIASMVLEYFIL